MSTDLAKTMPPGVWTEVLRILSARTGFAEEIADALADGLKATGVHFIRVKKGDGGSESGGEWETHPDFKTRLETVKVLLAYSEGLPLQRILQHTIDEKRTSVHEELRESPELLAAVEREVEKAKFGGRHKKARAAVQIDVP
jgi:hypothetical protein